MTSSLMFCLAECFNAFALYDSGSNGSVLYDPGGGYRAQEKGSGDALYDENANLPDYIKHQEEDGSNVETYHFPTTPEEDAEIQKRIEGGGCSPGLCSACSGNVLRGIGPFKNLGATFLPSSMARELSRLQGR